MNAISELSESEILEVDGGINAQNVAAGFAYAAIGTVAVATGGVACVAVGAFLVGAGFWLASV